MATLAQHHFFVLCRYNVALDLGLVPSQLLLNQLSTATALSDTPQLLKTAMQTRTFSFGGLLGRLCLICMTLCRGNRRP